MAYICFNCGKGNTKSQRSLHHKGVAGGRWKHKAPKTAKLFRANLHYVRLMVGGTRKRIKLCTDCISKLRKSGKLSTSGSTIVPLATPTHAPVAATQ